MTNPVILLGTQANGDTLPVQVDATGRLVAEGLQGPEGPPGPPGPQGPGGDALDFDIPDPTGLDAGLVLTTTGQGCDWLKEFDDNDWNVYSDLLESLGGFVEPGYAATKAFDGQYANMAANNAGAGPITWTCPISVTIYDFAVRMGWESGRPYTVTLNDVQQSIETGNRGTNTSWRVCNRFAGMSLTPGSRITFLDAEQQTYFGGIRINEIELVDASFFSSSFQLQLQHYLPKILSQMKSE